MKKINDLLSSGNGTTAEIKFSTIATDFNILKAQVNKPGKARSLYILTIPDESIDDFDENEFVESSKHEFA